MHNSLPLNTALQKVPTAIGYRRLINLTQAINSVPRPPTLKKQTQKKKICL